MRKHLITSACTAALMATSAAALAQGSSSTPAASAASPAATAGDTSGQAMEKLRAAAQHLRESVQAMAQKQPGPDRDRAIDQAHDALLETQRAMVALPPDMRGSGRMPDIEASPPSQRRGTASVSDADYQRSVTQLMRAADSLRQSVQQMAQQPAGERRNRAMEQARQALWDTQQAMVAAYDPGSASRAMGAQGANASAAAAGGQRMRPDRN
ncbi:hypothetical protein [Ramlibacter rhizophilus]|uniref:DUF4142 domain-containing protein n=1 Tax=Ramlibacter rhizophilus TaxID=1781167 RepID=A0A4Z0BM64_9BURK|nr:hypothetical protein [Ramlibacter rhizophilus]TFY99900.1 hypothetical protein EZ242_12255 [Ramlibacter rhizophilus]